MYSHTPMPDMDTAAHLYPPVVVQLPMFNEREVCRQVIDAACELEWPRAKLLVQVLDDSTDDIARERIQDAVAAWREAGINIVYRWRSNREGYKAGAMALAMEEIKEYEHCGEWRVAGRRAAAPRAAWDGTRQICSHADVGLPPPCRSPLPLPN